MTDPAKRERAGAIGVALAFVVAGCFGDSGVGPCTLKISADEQGTWRVVEQPYRVRLGPISEPTALIFSGTGWTQMNVGLRHSSGFSQSGRLTLQDITGETTGFTVDRLGQWQLRLSDPVSGCLQEVAVEVVP